MGKWDASIIFLYSGKMTDVWDSNSEMPSPSVLKDPTPTATGETLQGVAVLAICMLHMELLNLCHFLLKFAVDLLDLTLCTKCTSISGSSSRCPH